jgi:hypothetical protein
MACGEAAIRSALAAGKLDRVDVDLVGQGRQKRVVGAGGDGDERRGPLAAGRAGPAGEGGALGEGERARGPGHEVEADGVGAGAQGRVEAGVVDTRRS